jgi:hypothetical protein
MPSQRPPMAAEPYSDWPLTLHWGGIRPDQIDALGLPAIGSSKRIAACSCIVADLVLARHAGDRWVSYSRRRDHYSLGRRYRRTGYTYAFVTRTVRELRDGEMIEEQRANPGTRGWQSRMRATDRLTDGLGALDGLTYDPVEIVRFKNTDGQLIDYRDTPDTHRMRREVRQLNEAFATITINLEAPDVGWHGHVVRVDDKYVLPKKVAGYRVFNGDWALGGRYYGPFWQNLPKLRRAQLTIDGVGVVEHDFAQLHPRLLYAHLGLRLDGDAYSIAGYDESDRPLNKKGWNILLNATSRRSAITALARELRGPAPLARSADIIRAIEHRHEPIRGALGSGLGLRLQRIDSDLMMAIEARCLSEGIVALPVHDSFIAKRGRDADRVTELMDSELNRVLAQASDSKSFSVN